jgi:hypothetical protein
MTHLLAVPTYTFAPVGGLVVDGFADGPADPGDPRLANRVWMMPTMADTLDAASPLDTGRWTASFDDPSQTCKGVLYVADSAAIVGVRVWRFLGGQEWRRVGGDFLVGPGQTITDGAGVALPLDGSIYIEIRSVYGNATSLSLAVFPLARSYS